LRQSTRWMVDRTISQRFRTSYCTLERDTVSRSCRCYTRMSWTRIYGVCIYANLPLTSRPVRYSPGTQGETSDLNRRSTYCRTDYDICLPRHLLIVDTHCPLHYGCPFRAVRSSLHYALRWLIRCFVELAAKLLEWHSSRISAT
jgi:hypothetical protein